MEVLVFISCFSKKLAGANVTPHGILRLPRDGRINVYSLDAKYLGQLRSHDHTIVIDGLWALSFAPSTATAIDPARLYFSAGPDNEADGLFGYLIKR